MDFRTNSWYRLATAASMRSQQSMAGTAPSISGREGRVVSASSNNNTPAQQWQLFPVDASTFMLRTKASGPYGYLAAENNNASAGDTIPRIYNHTRTDSSMLWRIVPWGDGTFHLSNIPNGKGCHLDFAGTEGVRMNANITQPQPGQAFSFVRLGDIDDFAFSTIATPPPSTLASPLSPTPISSTTASPTSVAFASSTLTSATLTGLAISQTSAPPSTPSQPQHHKLSTSAAMGVGVTIGALGLTVFTALGLLFYQRWRKLRSTESKHYRRAKLWKGFTPQYRASNISVRATKSTGDVYVAELPEIATPSAVLGSPLSERHFSWQSWPAEGSPVSTFVPQTPMSPLAELPC